MTLEEFEKKIIDINIEWASKKRGVAKEYADSNSTVKIGDIVTDHVGSILVDRIEYRLSIEKPDCVYYGIELKKNGEKKKRESWRHVFQCNLKY